MKTLSIGFLTAFLFLVGDADAAGVTLVQNQLYHGDDVKDVRNGETWFALVQPGGDPETDIRVKQLKIRVKIEKDEVIDEGQEMTGREISSVEDAIVLLKGLPGLKDGQLIKTVKLAKSALKPGEQVDLTANGVKVILSASAMVKRGKSKQGVRSGVTGEVIKDYKWSVEVNGRKQLLVDSDDVYEGQFRLIWVGDLNGDGAPDIFADVANHYNVSIPTVFLSKKTPSGITYAPAATRRSTGC